MSATCLCCLAPQFGSSDDNGGLKPALAKWRQSKWFQTSKWLATRALMVGVNFAQYEVVRPTDAAYMLRRCVNPLLANVATETQDPRSREAPSGSADVPTTLKYVNKAAQQAA
jgi:hypothetical protein